MNGREYSKCMRKKIAYVMQEDIFFANLTVREQLTFTCQLRLPESVGHTEKEKAVDHVVRTLGIEKCQHTKIMLVSGGERKRCNIGTELLTNPSLILLDEPTSGLDSTAAAALMKTMRGLAEDRMTVIMSIHQPSSRVFYSFDQLMLLADGRTVYYGPPSKCLPYLSTLGFVPPADYNPADFVMDLLNSVEGPDPVAAAAERMAAYSAQGAVEFDMCQAYSAGAPGVFLEENASPRAVLIARWDKKAMLAAVELVLQGASAPRGKALDVEEGAGAGAETCVTADAMTDTSVTAASLHSEGVYEGVSEGGGGDREGSYPGGGGGEAGGGGGGVLPCSDLEGPKYPISYLTQLRVLFRRDFRNRRSELFRVYNVVECVLVGVIAGCAWFQMPRTEKSVDDRSSLIFFGILRWYFW
jgi:ABC-type multidrug transport system ATPase subunit